MSPWTHLTSYKISDTLKARVGRQLDELAPRKLSIGAAIA